MPMIKGISSYGGDSNHDVYTTRPNEDAAQ